MHRYLIEKKSVLLAVLFSLTLSLYSQDKWTSQFISVDPKGRLVYKPDEKGNVIPDFSRVGYYQGDDPIPYVPVVTRLSPGGDDEKKIQSAIDELSKKPVDANGFRGAILLTQGLYIIHGTLRIQASGIVLRGQGDSTRLIAVGRGQRNLLSVSGKGSPVEVPGTRRRITDAYVPVGAFSFNLADASNLKPGDRIILERPGTEKWISDLQMDRIEQRDSATRQWAPKEYDLRFERVITAIEGNKVTIDNPVVMAMEAQYGGGSVYLYRYDGRISNVGIERLYCESEFIRSDDEDHGWNAVHLNRVENAWVRNVTSRYFGYSCVNLGEYAKQVSVLNCRSYSPVSKITGGRRYSFNNDGQLNLFADCFASEGRHDYVTGARVCGPNVFVNCRAVNTHADTGPHHRWAVGTLYDNIITDGEINVQDRGNWGTGHGWAGVTQVLWNCTASRAVVQNPWVSGKNYAIGLNGEKYDGRLKRRPGGEWEGQRKPGLNPPSLYLAQKEQRSR